MMRTGVAFLLLFAFIAPAALRAQDKKIRTRVYGGPVIATYRNNDNYTANSRGRAAANLGVRFEYRLGPQAGLGPAVEYVTHGLRFDSYFFHPGQHAMYDRSFPYTHTVRIQELHVPVIFKYNFLKENEKTHNSNIMVGWGYRYMFSSRSTVIASGADRLTWDDRIDTEMEYSLLGRKGGAMLITGMGAEKNYQVSKTSIYAELLLKYTLTRWRYSTNGEAAPFYIKNSFIAINFGYKF